MRVNSISKDNYSLQKTPKAKLICFGSLTIKRTLILIIFCHQKVRLTRLKVHQGDFRRLYYLP